MSQGLGSIGYLSPERCRGESADVRADVFSLGVIGYELLTGRRLFGGDPLMYVASMRTAEPLPLPRAAEPRVDRDLDAVIAKATAKDPERRYETASALRQDLQAWLEGRPTEARPPRPIGVMLRWVRRHPLRVAAMASVLAAATAGSWLARFRNELTGLREAAANAAREAEFDARIADGFEALTSEFESAALARRLFEQVLAYDPTRTRAAAGLMVACVFLRQREDALGVNERYLPSVSHPADLRAIASRFGLVEDAALDPEALQRPLPLYVEALALMRESGYDSESLEVAFRSLLHAGLRGEPWSGLLGATAQVAVRRWEVRQDRQSLEDFAAAVRTLAARHDRKEIVLYWRARLAQARKELSSALELIDDAIALRSQSTSFHSRRGLILSQWGRHEEAVASFNRAIEFYQESAQLYYNRGNAHGASGHRSAAVADYETATRLDPDFRDAWLNLSNALRLTGRVNEAICAANTALSLGLSARACLMLGLALGDAGFELEADHALQRAITLDGHSSPGCTARVALGRAQYLRLRYHHARDLLTLAWQECDMTGLDPGAMVLSLRILIHTNVVLGDLDAALEWSSILSKESSVWPGVEAALALATHRPAIAERTLPTPCNVQARIELLSDCATHLDEIGLTELAGFTSRIILAREPTHRPSIRRLLGHAALADAPGSHLALASLELALE